MEKRIEIDQIKKIEIKLEKLKIRKAIVNTIRKSVIREKYSHYIVRHEKYCA